MRHTGAVARSRPPQLVVADLPWASYHPGRTRGGGQRRPPGAGGGGAVKLEGGAKRLEGHTAILDAEIPVMGHIGLTPQSFHAMGGHRVQGRSPTEAKLLIEDAIAICDAGCFALVVEGVPDDLAAEITRAVPVPTFGIGAGSSVTARCSCSTTSSGWAGRGCPVSPVATPNWRAWRRKPWRRGRPTSGRAFPAARRYPEPPTGLKATARCP